MNSGRVDESHQQFGTGGTGLPPHPRLNRQQQESQPYKSYQDNIQSPVNVDGHGVLARPGGECT